jgi:hypothetical protein
LSFRSLRGLVVILSLIIVGGLAYVALSPAVLPIQRTLRHVEPQREVSADMVEYASDAFLSGEGTLADGMRAANVYLRAERHGEERYRLRVSVWHTEETQLEGLQLRLDVGGPGGEVALVAPQSASWPRHTFHATRDARGVLLDIPRLGFAGRGTVTFDFLLQNPQEDELALEAIYSLYELQTVQLARYGGEVVIGFALP